MKILFLLHSFNINGVLFQNLVLVKYLLSNKYVDNNEVTVMAPKRKAGLKEFKKLKIKVKVFNPLDRNKHFPEDILSQKYDILFMESLFALNYYSKLFLSLSCKKRVLRVHEEIPLKLKKDLWNVNAKNPEGYFKNLKSVVLIFTGNKSRAHYKFFLNKYKIQSRIINNVIDIDKFSHVKKPKKNFIITQVGTLYQRKGAIKTMKSFQLFLTKNKLVKASLRFVGARKGKKVEDEYLKKLRSLIRIFRLGKKVEIFPVTTNINKFFQDSSIITLHSISESSPTVFLEACYNGIPFISSNVGCLKEMRNKFGNCLLFPYGDIEKQAKYFKKIYDNHHTIKPKFSKEQLKNIFQKNLTDLARIMKV